ncbi:MAG: MtnX-like HAD-IB family phosphatase [Betaproteobacteria bacterium]|nr:MtnX-like HAD-IB family phosphatase [Betaproteobacteria bacterium]MCL2886439.1 MtnX-like HAD-IB family phosphatase [Betaproteobacteria bacterium]
MTWSVLCDFDGTISTKDVTDTLLEAFGKPGWREAEDEWLAGRIGSRVCMQRQIACLDASKEELDEAIDAIGVDEAFAAFVDAVVARDWELLIVSDGLDYAIKRILQRHRLPALPFYANRLVQVGARSWQLDSPYADPACRSASGMCKCAFAHRARAAGGKVLMIGDGRSDFCVAGDADWVFAKGRLMTHCFEKSLPHVPISGFADALRIIPAAAEHEFALAV